MFLLNDSINQDFLNKEVIMKYFVIKTFARNILQLPIQKN